MMSAVPMPTLTPRPTVSVEALYEGVVAREPFVVSDGKSGSPFERLTLDDGSVRIVKHVHVDDDWTMRMTGDIGCHPAQVWRDGLMDVLPERIDHGVLAVADGLGRNGWGASILMRDLSAEMVRPGDDVISLQQHLSLIDDMAAFCARMWGWRDVDGHYVPLGARWTWFNDASLVIEEARGWPNPVPKLAAEGWGHFAARAPRDVGAVVDELRHDPSPLLARTRETPSTFLHGDWKLGNLGTGRDGRTVLIDWTYPGDGPCCVELVWYLALNRARMPISKEATIERFESALRANGIDTEGWFGHQLTLCLLAGLALFGWEKALGDEDELRWWCDRAREGIAGL
ncbi:MAG: phosphotransferase [Actinobacteria bacterium]|nr:phosphotransferase [Actinomycetota bacterium]